MKTILSFQRATQKSGISECLFSGIEDIVIHLQIGAVQCSQNPHVPCGFKKRSKTKKKIEQNKKTKTAEEIKLLIHFD